LKDIDLNEKVIEGRRRGISGSTLKIIACVTMLIDHLGAFVLLSMIHSGYRYSDFDIIKCYDIFRDIGRVAIPIFIFLMIQGLYHTSDVKKYIGRMAIFALISEIPFNLARTSNIIEIGSCNVFFTLTLGLVAIASIRYYTCRDKGPFGKGVVIIAMVLSAIIVTLIGADYGIFGVMAAIVGYVFMYEVKLPSFRSKCLLSIIGITAILISMDSSENYAIFAILPVVLYNGKRGFKLKYFFYLFYPIHLIVLFMVRTLLLI